MQHLQFNTTLQSGKYRIEGVLGQGGFGITYMAENVYTHKYVAIKELYIAKEGQVINSRQGNSVTLTSYAYQGTFSKHKEKFKKEAYRLSTLRHPNIVNVYECFEENGTAYYVMDLIVGESLQSKLKREGALPEKLVSSYLNQLLSALMVVHEKNIWHLDIKPANIMVDKYGHIYLIDFGASKHIEQNYGSLTTSSMMLGSQGFCPPEQCDNAMQHIGEWTDIYALGATLYALLTNRNPPSLNAIISGGSNAFVFPNTVSQKMRELVIWMMKVNRNERPQNVLAVLSSLSGNERTIRMGNKQSNPQRTFTKEQAAYYPKSNDSSTTKWIIGAASVILVSILALIIFIKSSANHDSSSNGYSYNKEVYDANSNSLEIKNEEISSKPEAAQNNDNSGSYTGNDMAKLIKIYLEESDNGQYAVDYNIFDNNTSLREIDADDLGLRNYPFTKAYETTLTLSGQPFGLKGTKWNVLLMGSRAGATLMQIGSNQIDDRKMEQMNSLLKRSISGNLIEHQESSLYYNYSLYNVNKGYVLLCYEISATMVAAVVYVSGSRNELNYIINDYKTGD